MAADPVYSDVNQFDSARLPGRAILKNDQAVRQALFNILNVRKGELLFNPSFGTDVDRILFRTITPETTLLLYREVAEAIDIWEQRLALDSSLTTVEPDPEDNAYEATFVGEIRGIVDQQFRFTGSLRRGTRR